MRALRFAVFSFALWFIGCGRDYRVGDEVMVEWEGKVYPAVIQSASGPTKFKVHFDGYDEAWDEVVPKSRIKGFRKGDEPRPEPPAKVRQKAIEAAKSNKYNINDQVRVEWNGRYYPATIKDVVGKERYRIRYDGYGPEFDENVPLARIQPK